ncbi:hypothetical protein ACVILJ_001033 [Bradyrhizobium diazoefficiens]
MEYVRPHCLAQTRRQLAQIFAAERENVECVELHLVVVPARMLRVEVGHAVDAEHHASPSMMNCCSRFFSTASTIQGKRVVRSWPLRVNSRAVLPLRSTRER